MTIDRLFRTRHECDKPTRILTVGEEPLKWKFRSRKQISTTTYIVVGNYV